jgi:hypothetical protein
MEREGAWIQFGHPAPLAVAERAERQSDSSMPNDKRYNVPAFVRAGRWNLLQ